MEILWGKSMYCICTMLIEVIIEISYVLLSTIIIPLTNKTPNIVLTKLDSRHKNKKVK